MSIIAIIAVLAVIASFIDMTADPKGYKGPMLPPSKSPF